MRDDRHPAVSVVLGSYNRKHFLKKTIQSVREEIENAPFISEIIIIDGGSTDGTLNWLKKQKDIITIIQHNRGTWKGNPIERRSWGYFMNLGFKCAQGKYICMISDDCLVVPGAIINGFKQFENVLKCGNNIGAIAFYWRNWPEMDNYWIGYTLGNKIFVNHGMYLNKALKEVGYIDEDTYHFYHADGDLCLKLWNNNFSIIKAEDSYIEHFSHANFKIRKSNLSQQKKDWQNYLNKWTGIFYDPKNDNHGFFERDEQKVDDDLVKKYWKFCWLKVMFFRKLHRLFQND